MRLVVQAEVAVPTRRDERRHDTITDLDTGHVGSDLGHHTRPFVAEQERQGPLQAALGGGQIGVADPAGLYPDTGVMWSDVSWLTLLDDQGLAVLMQNRCRALFSLTPTRGIAER